VQVRFRVDLSSQYPLLEAYAFAAGKRNKGVSNAGASRSGTASIVAGSVVLYINTVLRCSG